MDNSPELVPCSFLIPLAYNDGRPVELERREKFEDRIFIEFGGYQVEGEITGAYRRSDNGQRQIETMVKMRVSVLGKDGIERLRQLIAEIGGELDQECMYLEVAAGTVAELVTSRKKGGL
jgi:hypothetical protein